MRSFPLRRNRASLACGELSQATDIAKKTTKDPAASIRCAHQIGVLPVESIGGLVARGMPRISYSSSDARTDIRCAFTTISCRVRIRKVNQDFTLLYKFSLFEFC